MTDKPPDQKEWTKILLFITTLGTMLTLQFGSIISFTAIAVLIIYAVRFVRLTRREVVMWVGPAIVIGLVTLVTLAYFENHPIAVPMSVAIIPPIIGILIGSESCQAIPNAKKPPIKKPVMNSSVLLVPTTTLSKKLTSETKNVKRAITALEVIAAPAKNKAKTNSSIPKRLNPAFNSLPNSEPVFFDFIISHSLSGSDFLKFTPFEGEGVI